MDRKKRIDNILKLSQQATSTTPLYEGPGGEEITSAKLVQNKRKLPSKYKPKSLSSKINSESFGKINHSNDNDKEDETQDSINKKISYYSGEDSFIKTPSPYAGEDGARGFSASEMTSEYDDSDSSHDPNAKDVQDMSTNYSEDDLMEKLINISDALDFEGLETSANFTDFLIKKFAIALKLDPTDLFNNIIIKIKRADISDTNKIIKNLTKIYSRTILVEYIKNNDLDKSKESAYKKVLHRANQYLSEE